MADGISAPGRAPHIQDLIATRFSRRALLAGLAGLPALSLASCATPVVPHGGAAATLPSFTPVGPTLADSVTVPEGFLTQTLIGWGDALFADMPAFDADTVSRADQERRFGMNNDMLALFARQYAFPPPTTQNAYLLAVNHEYAGPEMMFPNSLESLGAITPAQAAALFASMGISIVEIARSEPGGDWAVQRAPAGGATLNRRITPFTPVLFDGPAAGHRWVRAAGAAFNAAERLADSPSVACGTLANCAGGQTPWGTYLSAEENFNFYFGQMGEETEALLAARADEAFQRDARSFGTPLNAPQARPSPRQYNMATNPYGPALYGWTVEVDPHDKTWTPRKRTALGRRKGECATTALTRDGRVAVYSGDDQADEFVYKFISRGRFNPHDRLANRDLLSEGQLFVAQFKADGGGDWLALTVEAANAAADAAGLAAGARFADEGDLMLRARDAARLMGATPMDRPEDVEAILDGAWVGQGPVLIVCTNNRDRRDVLPGSPDRSAGDRSVTANLAGHILRLDEDGADCGATRFRWDVFALGGDPDSAAGVATTRAGATANVSTALAAGVVNVGDRFACPDNICFDTRGHVWIATDGSDAVFGDCNDAVLVTAVAGDGPRTVRRFLVGPVGAEICGPTLTPDETAFFVAIQHPGENDASGESFSRARWRATGTRPASSFPDGNGAWPRSAVVVVSRADKGPVTA